MKHILTIIIAVAIAISTSSCSQDEVMGEDNWGSTNWYPNRFYYSYQPTTMSRTLEVSLNDDAYHYMDTEEGYFELSISKAPNKYVKPDDIKVYYNNELTDDGKFRISVNEAKSKVFTVEVGIEFCESATEGAHQYYIVYTDQMNGKDEITVDGVELAADKEHIKVDMAELDDRGFIVEKRVSLNPADKVLICIGSLICACLALWLIFGKYLFYRRIRITRLQLTGPGTFNRTPTVKGCYRVVLTANRRQKQGLIARIFTGKVLYIYDDEWTDEICFQHHSKKGIRIRTSGGWTCDSIILQRHNTYKIENMTSKQKCEITIV